MIIIIIIIIRETVKAIKDWKCNSSKFIHVTFSIKIKPALIAQIT